jgi:hypothetical protein
MRFICKCAKKHIKCSLQNCPSCLTDQRTLIPQQQHNTTHNTTCYQQHNTHSPHSPHMPLHTHTHTETWCIRKSQSFAAPSTTCTSCKCAPSCSKTTVHVCHVVLCCVMSCCVMLCCVVSCHVMSCVLCVHCVSCMSCDLTWD